MQSHTGHTSYRYKSVFIIQYTIPSSTNGATFVAVFKSYCGFGCGCGAERQPGDEGCQVTGDDGGVIGSVVSFQTIG